MKIHFQNYHLIKVGKNSSKDIYNIIIQKKKESPTCKKPGNV